ncbi:right-handed parallel beta-helix repeat-containing protein [Nocardioides sp. CER19]|uniref:right-handed parallel beta-helix repeat-containing protein n=1 Tax=Nocardioides sp. CER19 TaxID=3038538 RepID=UPI00244C99F5|nr:right-handed parallel beta-helix repeat-containing protein [Nocardioides sp. CER19]MDH2413347.1 right-handed parallel beta-helix repeat-containing protein [Nocardioides sp. CER19]
MARGWATAGGIAAVVCLGAAGCSSGSAPRAGHGVQVVRVPQDATSIQAAVDHVAAGGLVLVGPGTYHESVVVSTADVTVRGTDRNRTVIDGAGVRPYGVVSIADGTRVQNLTVRDHTFYGVLVTGVHDKHGPRANNADDYDEFEPDEFPPVQRFAVDHVTAYDNGLYGIYAFDAQHGVIADSYASGSADSGIYVGQCHSCDVLVQDNVAERNAVGFENANASGPLLITGNRFTDNRVGLTLLSNYQEAFRPQRANQVIGNLVGESGSNDSPAQADGGFGTGVGIAGGVDNEVTRNRIAGNPRAGVLITNTEDLPATGNTLTENAYAANGIDVANISAARAPATGNCVTGRATTLPPDLATARPCGAAARRQPAVAPTTVARLAKAPPGLSFLDVAPPRAQPGLTDVDTPPERLPASVTMPDTAAIDVPPGSLLAELSGTR